MAIPIKSDIDVKSTSDTIPRNHRVTISGCSFDMQEMKLYSVAIKYYDVNTGSGFAREFNVGTYVTVIANNSTSDSRYTYVPQTLKSGISQRITSTSAKITWNGEGFNIIQFKSTT